MCSTEKVGPSSAFSMGRDFSSVKTINLSFQVRFPGVRAVRDVANDIERSPKKQISLKSQEKSVAQNQSLLEDSEVNKMIFD